MKKIAVFVCLLLCAFLFGGCSRDPEFVTKEELDEAIRQSVIELEEDALDLFELVGRERTCQYFEEEIRNELTENAYSAQICSDLVSYTIGKYKLIYDRYFAEPNEELEQLVQLNGELEPHIQTKSDVYHKYTFDFYNCVGDIRCQNLYVSYRIESTYDDNLLGMIQKEIESYTENGSYWCAYNAIYDQWLGTLPGDDISILYSANENPFSAAGVYEIYSYADGTTLTMVDSKGFQKEVPILHLIDANDYFSFIDADNAMSQVIERIGDVYGISLSFGVNNTEMADGNVESGQVTSFDYLGIWQDSNSGRCNMEIDKMNDTYYSIFIQWSSSATESVEWVCDAEYDEENKRLVYTCVCNNVVYMDDGTVQSNLIYDNGEGIIYIGSDGNLYWEDFVEDRGADCVFTKL